MMILDKTSKKFEIKKICIIRTDKIGDIILTLPLIEQTKKIFPESEVTLISSSYTNDITENLSFIDKIYNKDKFGNRLKNIFKEYKPDVIFFPRPRYDEIKDAFLAGIKYRIGSAYRWYSLLLNTRVKDHRKIANFHEAEYNIRMLWFFLENTDSQLQKCKDKYAIILPEIYYNSDIKFENLLIDEISPNIKPLGYFIIHPGSGGSARDWSAENMGKLGNLISTKFNFLPIISGTKNEYNKCKIAEEYCPNSLNLCGKLSLKMMKPLIKNAKLLISNSTGIIHIAASLKTPVIGFYPNSPHLSDKRWGPLTEKKLIISPENFENGIFNDDMNSISVNFAFEEILKSKFIDKYE